MIKMYECGNLGRKEGVGLMKKKLRMFIYYF